MRKKWRAEESVIKCLYYKYVQIVISHECICTTTECEFQRVKKLLQLTSLTLDSVVQESFFLIVICMLNFKNVCMG